MEKEIIFDFSDINDYNDFYEKLKSKLIVPEWFGNNLDALFDFITAYTGLPLYFRFFNVSFEQLETFDDLLSTLEDAEAEVDDFRFSYYMVQYEDDSGFFDEEDF